MLVNKFFFGLLLNCLNISKVLKVKWNCNILKRWPSFLLVYSILAHIPLFEVVYPSGKLCSSMTHEVEPALPLLCLTWVKGCINAVMVLYNLGRLNQAEEWRALWLSATASGCGCLTKCSVAISYGIPSGIPGAGVSPSAEATVSKP